MPEGILRLEGIELRATLGLLPVEKLHPRLVGMDLEWRGPFSPGSPPVVDYGSAAAVLGSLEGRDFDYVEALACEALDLLRASFPGGTWTVRVVKACPPAPLRSARAVFEVSG
jgi:dihydroneopterin aldolase